ncbi:allantoate amidohydrolase [Caballeronia mineralivorans PML1(12)]|uniref:Allantoate amidohydrolase n=1 Tax=Caballeronia mineralivorans PML1(12) TaxID=908627 RepID=A0A0J1CWY0_9BURK|nr:Zn-dependent hydrolase [Caballeronia mineralivorans]KLU25070.1 allantoate amidohydrolase [Caballeronia mineralivorans PML1(12)]
MTLEPDFNLACALFERLRAESFDGVGITRDSYGAGEQCAHDAVEEAARGIGLEISTDAALNLYMTLPGRDRAAPARMTGSHLDSVPCGGNFDGAAGVVAGLAVLSGWIRAGHVPRADTTVMAIRAEESAWFPVSYVGSRAAFGLLPPDALDAARSDSGERLSACLARLGGDPEKVRAGIGHLDAARIECFIELHIEQGPVLIDAGDEVGIVSGICGSLRYRGARAFGVYAHSGATPRSHRQDAVLGVSAFVIALHAAWAELEGAGHELTVTVGRFATDPLRADFSKVSGCVDFCIDVRSLSLLTLGAMDKRIGEAVAQVAATFGVRIELGAQTRSAPAQMTDALRSALLDEAKCLAIRTREMPSGAGHDAAVFATQGVRTAMIFVRNAKGSHNPDEAMNLADFAQGTRLLSQVLQGR